MYHGYNIGDDMSVSIRNAVPKSPTKKDKTKFTLVIINIVDKPSLVGSDVLARGFLADLRYASQRDPSQLLFLLRSYCTK